MRFLKLVSAGYLALGIVSVACSSTSSPSSSNGDKSAGDDDDDDTSDQTDGRTKKSDDTKDAEKTAPACKPGKTAKASECGCLATDEGVRVSNGWCAPYCDQDHACPSGTVCNKNSDSYCAPACSSDDDCLTPVKWNSCDIENGFCTNN